MGTRWFLIAIALLAAGCQDDTGPRDRVPPAAPRGVYTVTGDGDVFVHWLANTEGDVAGYRIYEAPCASGDGCPYDRVGTTTGTSFTVTGLTNGQTRYFAVSAYDVAGNESDLSAEILFDTPRPEGVGQVLNNFNASAAGSGYDFSAFTARNWDDPQTDMYFGFNGSIDQMFVPAQTSIQDYGYASSLDAVDFAPTTGWSPSGTVELIVGHCYIVWTHDDHYAKFRVTEIRPAANGAPAKIVFDWLEPPEGGVCAGRRGSVSPRGCWRRRVAPSDTVKWSTAHPTASRLDRTRPTSATTAMATATSIRTTIGARTTDIDTSGRLTRRSCDFTGSVT
ncbi:MAG: hypothetical protein E6K80_05175 [Candidatus Eisenbacteria bacterium]|uniref:Fibronectin type-III domain-containing protein n=1 Tax=Eiseniibacteriota bacterium TaxID=2212470 RepID=A0A538U6R5_UNCEI|nr:MAG: hypothetical protein E6K80_05175 [Candidatus Eisenbacteria bacterium]